MIYTSATADFSLRVYVKYTENKMKVTLFAGFTAHLILKCSIINQSSSSPFSMQRKLVYYLF